MEKRNALWPFPDFPYPFESTHVGHVNSGDQMNIVVNRDSKRTMGRLVKRASVILPKYVLLKRSKTYMARTGKRSGNMDPEYSVKNYLVRVGKRQENDDKRYIPRLGKRGGYKRVV